MTSQVVQKARPLSDRIWLLGRQRVLIRAKYKLHKLGKVIQRYTALKSQWNES